MNSEVSSANPAVRSVIEGTAPRAACVAASRGILPLPPSDVLEVLVAFAEGPDAELSENASKALHSYEAGTLSNLIQAEDAAPRALSFFARRTQWPADVHAAVIGNSKTPPDAIVELARSTRNGALIELITLNQQRLIQIPGLLDAILQNPGITSEAERRAAETKREFFEKERGAQQIANELRAQGNEAAAQFIENAEFAQDLGASGLSAEDAMFLASHIEVSDLETDDSWLALDYIEEIYQETQEQRQMIFDKILGDMQADGDEMSNERISMLNRIMRMGVKDRVKLAMKGDREARNILIRDPNRLVSQAVANNPRISEQEVEAIAAMRTVPEDILRSIAASRQWSRVYAIAHNLVRNPRTPIANSMTLMTRMQLRDLNALSKNRNVSDAVRRHALRLTQNRSGTKS